MGSVYIYEANEDDFSTIGICGTLLPKSCTFHEIANGMSSVRLEHPIDEMGRYACLQENRILKCDVPVRTTPEIENGAFVTRIEQYTVKNTATKLHRYIYNKANPSAKKQKKLKLVPVGGKVSITKKYSDDNYRWKCKYTWQEKKKKKKVNKTVTGYIDHDSTTLAFSETVIVDNTPTGIEAVAPSWRIQEQLFRIASVEKSEKMVQVEANHISYDMMYNLTSYDESGSRTLQEAGDEMLEACFDDHQYTFQTNIQGSKQGFHFRDKDPITALLDPDTGLVPRWNGELIRDNYSFTVLDHAGANRGTMFSYGKNVKGITVNLDFSGVATAIRPVGETEKGKPVYLEHSYLWNGTTATALSDTDGIVYGRWHYLTGDDVECRLPCARIYPLDGEDCKENSKDGPSIATVRRRLLDQAVAKLEGGAEEPEVSVQVDMMLLGYTQQWSMYRDLEKVFLFDTIRVRHQALGIDIETAICEIEWDCLEDMPLEIRTGAINDLTASISSWQISSLNGAKLTAGSVNSMQLADGAVGEDHIQAASVTANAIAANAITANNIAAGAITTVKLDAGCVTAAKIDAGAVTTEKLDAGCVTANAIAANAITADKIAAGAVDAQSIAAVTAMIQNLTAADIQTNTFYAAFAHMMALTAGSIQAGSISADALAAVMAQIVSLTAKLADVDYLRVKDITANQAIITDGLAEELYIERLAVTSANMVNAVIGSLIVKGDDNKYYAIHVGAEGGIVTEEVTVSQEEIDAGETESGRQIVTTTVNAASLNGTTVKASQAILGTILTDALTAGAITAMEATIASAQIPALYTSVISALGNELLLQADDAIRLLLSNAGQYNSYFDFTGSGLRIRRDGSKWSTLAGADGYYIDHDEVAGHVGAFRQDGLTVDGIQIGDIIARKTERGGWAWVSA